MIRFSFRLRRKLKLLKGLSLICQVSAKAKWNYVKFKRAKARSY